ncbi:uncharacterized protein TM35_000021100 [Trypanosoma theileri]|uniref:Uncharacterized protein n=1 Tax=Trypanosoma theileri TaxID=67003 RepID=A0A1X0P779_9TRYP|nr:uncharacterized protein TM35_000021100 [Trypanosoma theileri]ORC92784.1 hypothetical protein TM35_000021100 [Trypanosoma theileri]
MIGCVPPAGYIKTHDGRTIPPRVVNKGINSNWITSQNVEKGEILWSENLFVFCGGVSEDNLSVLTENVEWNQLASAVWNAMVSKGGERVTFWAMGFNALARVLLVASNSPNSIGSFFIESRSVSPQRDYIPVSLATLLVKGMEKLKGVSPFPPVVATWLLMTLQERIFPLSKDSSSEMKVKLNGFLFLSRKAAIVPIEKAANAKLSVSKITQTGDVILHCVATKTIAEGAQVRLHMGRSIAESMDIPNNWKDAWNNYCSLMEKRLLLGIH